jgi:hypothetical protein
MIVRAVMQRSEGRKATVPKVADLRTSIRYFDNQHCIAWHGSIQIVLSTVAPSMPVMAEIAEQLEKLGAQCRGGTGCLLIISSDASPPDDEGRKFIRIILERSSMLATAQVVLGTGFRGAAMRSVLSLLQMAIRPKYAMRIFGDVRVGGEWLTEVLQAKTTGTLPAESLVDTALELVAQVF